MDHISVYDEGSISIPGQTLFYYKAGSGELPLIAFHGFGQTHKAFNAWISHLEHKYTLILVDLYFHGKSTWTDVDRTLEKNVWKEAVRLIIEQEHITTFSLAGYSMGGKFALATLEAFPGSVKELFLIAPEGITRNFWYSMATWPMPLRKLFKSMIGHDHRFARLTHVARSLRLADKKVLRFAENQMDTENKRARVYNTWVIFRHLQFNMRDISEMINRLGIPVIVITGRYDRIVPPHRIRGPLNRLKNMNFQVVDSGHNDLITMAIPFLAK